MPARLRPGERAVRHRRRRARPLLCQPPQVESLRRRHARPQRAGGGADPRAAPCLGGLPGRAAGDGLGQSQHCRPRAQRRADRLESGVRAGRARLPLRPRAVLAAGGPAEGRRRKSRRLGQEELLQVPPLSRPGRPRAATPRLAADGQYRAAESRHRDHPGRPPRRGGASAASATHRRRRLRAEVRGRGDRPRWGQSRRARVLDAAGGHRPGGDAAPLRGARRDPHKDGAGHSPSAARGRRQPAARASRRDARRRAGRARPPVLPAPESLGARACGRGVADRVDPPPSGALAPRRRGLLRAHFPSLKTVDEYDFTFQSGVRLSLLGSALSADFITQGQSLVFSGPSGTGKTHVAIAIAYRAIQNGFDALFTTATALIEDLSTATRDGKLREALASYTHATVLVIDEVGYLGYGPDAANVLFQVVNDRYLHQRPMIFTTNKPLAAWGRVLHDPDLAEAILNRVIERGRNIELRGRAFLTPNRPFS